VSHEARRSDSRRVTPLDVRIAVLPSARADETMITIRGGHTLDNIDEHAINVYTDGSSYSGPRRGGLGARIITVNDAGNEEVYDYQPLGVRNATNQQMELLACIEVLELLFSRGTPIDTSRYNKIIIFTDSRYVVDNVDNAKFRWPQSKWHTRDGAPVVNADLWKRLVRAIRDHRRVDFKWVKGHKTSVHNKAVDKLAKASAKGSLRAPMRNVTVRRKLTTETVEVGSLRPEGQRLTVRIITDEYLPVQRCRKYKIEVVSKGSPYRGKVDLVYSSREILLKAGHTYYVQLNAAVGNPRIDKVFREISKSTKTGTP